MHIQLKLALPFTAKIRCKLTPNMLSSAATSFDVDLHLLSSCDNLRVNIYPVMHVRTHSQIQNILSLITFCLVDEGRDDPNTTKSGQLLAHQRNAISMAFRWWAELGPT